MKLAVVSETFQKELDANVGGRVECAEGNINADGKGGEVMAEVETKVEPKVEVEVEEKIEPKKVNLRDLSPKELLAAIEHLAPAQLKAVGEAARTAGLAPAPSSVGEGGVTLPDGRVQVTLTIDPDLGAQLKLWAEAHGSSLASFIVDIALTSYVQMDWEAAKAV